MSEKNTSSSSKEPEISETTLLPQQPTFQKLTRYSISLDLPPENRWTHVINKHKTQLRALAECIRKERQHFLSFIATPVSFAFGKIAPLLFNSEYIRELRGIAEDTEDVGLTFDMLVQFNLGYSVYSHCTSAVVQTPEGPHLFRNMDFELECLRDLAIEVEFKRQGNVIAVCNTWVGCVGVLTGMRSGGWGVAVNFRYLNNYPIWNITQMLTRNEPVEFLMRRILCAETEIPFTETIKLLSSIGLISPAYIILCGKQKGEGVIITRNRRSAEKHLFLPPKSRNSKIEYIVQTNIDHWKSNFDFSTKDELLLSSPFRREKLCNHLDKVEQEGTWESKSWEDLGFEALSQPGVLNKHTLYQTVMSPMKNEFISRGVKFSQ